MSQAIMMTITILIVMRTYDYALSHSEYSATTYSDGRTLCLKSIEIAAQWLNVPSNSLQVVERCIGGEQANEVPQGYAPLSDLFHPFQHYSSSLRSAIGKPS